MKQLANLLARYPGPIALGIALLTTIALIGCLKVTTEASNDSLFLRNSKSYRIYQTFRTVFGSDETLLVALHDPSRNLLEPDGLTTIQALTQDLKNFRGVDAVASLTTAQALAHLKITPFGIAAPRLIETDHLTAEQRQVIRESSLVMGTLLSTDLHTAGLIVTPTTEALSPGRLPAWTTDFRNTVNRYATQGRQVYIAGTPIERHDVASYLQRDQQLTVPLVFVILLGITYGLYRQLRLALIPLLCVLISLSWTLGIVGFSGRPLNLITSLLSPVIMVVSVSAAIHLLNSFLAALASGCDQRDAVAHSLHQVGMACWLTALTTMMGFASLFVSPVPAVQEFASFAGLGVGLSFVVTMTVVPLILLKIHPRDITSRGTQLQHRLEQILVACFHWVISHRWTVGNSTLIVLALALAGIPRLSEGTDIVRALKPTAPLRLGTEFIDQHLTGVNSLELMLTLPDTGTDPSFIRQALSFSDWLRNQPDVATVHSPWELMRDISSARLADDDQLRVIATLLPLSLPLDHWLNAESHRLRISVRVNAMASDRLLTLAREVAERAQLDGLPVQLTGTNYLLAQMSRTLVFTQVRSLLIAILLILGCMTLVLRSLKLGLLAAIPNLLPLLLIFGLMGWAGVMLSTATTMIASVALGLIVDDTIHLLYRYREETQAGHLSSSAMEHAIRQTGPSLVITTLILTLGFWAGLSGSFKPTVSFAFLTGLTMIVALLADLLVLPATLCRARHQNR